MTRLALVVAVGLMAWLGITTVVGRPQPVSTADVEAAETATRRAAVIRLCAGWIALNCLIASSSPVGPIATIGLLGILVGWLWVPSRVYRWAGP